MSKAHAKGPTSSLMNGSGQQHCIPASIASVATKTRKHPARAGRRSKSSVQDDASSWTSDVSAPTQGEPSAEVEEYGLGQGDGYYNTRRSQTVHVAKHSRGYFDALMNNPLVRTLAIVWFTLKLLFWLIPAAWSDMKALSAWCTTVRESIAGCRWVELPRAMYNIACGVVSNRYLAERFDFYFPIRAAAGVNEVVVVSNDNPYNTLRRDDWTPWMHDALETDYSALRIRWFSGSLWNHTDGFVIRRIVELDTTVRTTACDVRSDHVKSVPLKQAQHLTWMECTEKHYSCPTLLDVLMNRIPSQKVVRYTIDTNAADLIDRPTQMTKDALNLSACSSMKRHEKAAGANRRPGEGSSEYLLHHYVHLVNLISTERQVPVRFFESLPPPPRTFTKWVMFWRKG